MQPSDPAFRGFLHDAKRLGVYHRIQCLLQVFGDFIRREAQVVGAYFGQLGSGTHRCKRQRWIDA